MQQNPQILSSTYKSFRNAQKQNVQGHEFIEIEPITKSSALYEFELSGNEPLGFGIGTGFRVQGVFQSKATGADSEWITATADDIKKVTLQPNWFDHFIKQVDVFYVNNQVNPNDMPPNTDAYINSFLYAHMHKDIKRMLCMEKCHPGNSVTVDHGNFKAKGATDTSTNEWHKYAESVFAKDQIEFLYTPLLKFPFYQDANYIYGEDGGFTQIPINALGRMQIRVFMLEDTSALFNKFTGNTSSYRFVLNKMTLLTRELRMSPTSGRQLQAYKGIHNYRGVTKIGVCESIAARNLTHRALLPNIDMPQGLFIFCLNKNVVNGTAKFQDMSLDGPFLPHNIKSVDVHLNGQHFSVKSPSIGSIGNFQMIRVNYANHIFKPPFGVLFDPEVATFNRVGMAEDYAYPHIYIDLTESGPHTRIQPVPADNNLVTNKLGDLTLILQFNTPDGATADSNYIITAFYTDHNLQLDMKTKRFSPLYNRNKNIN